MAGWVAGNCETITNLASAEARVEALAELGKNNPNIRQSQRSGKKDKIPIFD